MDASRERYPRVPAGLRIREFEIRLPPVEQRMAFGRTHVGAGSERPEEY